MAETLGAGTITGIGLEGTYNTAVAATNKLNLISNGLDVETQQNLDVTLCGVGDRDKSRPGRDVASGPVVVQMTYDLRQPLLEQFSDGYTDEVAPTLDHYDWNLRSTQSLTIATLKRNTTVHEVAGCKTNTLTITGNGTDDIRMTADILAGTRTITGTVNTAASLGLLTVPALDILYNEMTLWIGDLADALAGGDEYNPESFTLTVSRNMVHHFVNDRTPLEAVEDGHRDVTLQIVLPRTETDQFITWKETYERIQCQMAFTDGTSNKIFRFPCGVVESAPQTVDGPEQQPTTITMRWNNNMAGLNAFTGFDFDEALRLFED